MELEYCNKVIKNLLRDTEFDNVGGVGVFKLTHITPNILPIEHVSIILNNKSSGVMTPFTKFIINTYGLKGYEIQYVKDAYIEQIEKYGRRCKSKSIQM
jgi:hypothetical protein